MNRHHAVALSLLVSATLLSGAAIALTARPSAQPQSAATAPEKPLEFLAVMEKPEKDEAETAKAINEAMREIRETTFANSQHAIRSVHAKSHGFMRGELRVLPNLPPALAQGVFAKEGTHPVLMRLSTAPGDILDDSVSTPRGMAIKMLGVSGDRLPGSEGQTTQDFLLVNGPTFMTADAKSFLRTLQLLAKTTDRFQPIKKAISVAARTTEKALETVGMESPMLKGSAGQPETHILGDTYYTQVPMLYGNYIAKVAVTPVSPELVALTNAHVELDGKPNALREAVSEFFARNGGEWEVRVQLATDLEVMPVENASVEWPEDKSPYVVVARISVKPQPTWNDEIGTTLNDTTKFSPWNGLAAHRPLGSIMRVRKLAYDESAKFRAGHNKRPVEEPRDVNAPPR